MFQPRGEPRTGGEVAGVEADDVGAAFGRTEYLSDDDAVIFRAIAFGRNEGRLAHTGVSAEVSVVR